MLSIENLINASHGKALFPIYKGISIYYIVIVISMDIYYIISLVIISVFVGIESRGVGGSKAKFVARLHFVVQ